MKPLIEKTLILAHRGASAYAPENTLEAFSLAADMGADGVELDVHLTADGQPVVHHDDKINRTSNAQGTVREYTLAELRAILARLESCRIPELSDSDFHPALNEALRTFENGRIELIRATALPSEHAAGTAVQTAAKTDLADIPAGTLFRKGAAFFLPLILTILFSAFFLALSFIIAWKVAL